MAVYSNLLSRIPGLKHGFGTLSEPVVEDLKNSWDYHAPKWKQIHGTKIVEVFGPHANAGEVDGMITAAKNCPIGVITADCVPILLCRQDRKMAAVLHAGWKGTFGQIVFELRRLLESRQENFRDWYAALGPAIGPCCYEVSIELEKEFRNKFAEMDPTTVFPKPRMLSLWAVNVWQLQKIGFRQIEVIHFCTKCANSVDSGQANRSDYLFHSYRREQNGPRQWSILEI